MNIFKIINVILNIAGYILLVLWGGWKIALAVFWIQIRLKITTE